MENYEMAFLFTFIAGFSTLLGTIPIFLKLKNENYIICSSLAFASGVMLCVSVIDLIPESFKMLNNYSGFLVIVIVFIFILIGILFSFFIDTSVSNKYNHHLYKVGIISMIAIILHNIPEGIITFISTSFDVSLGMSLGIAIMLHNIPEGISISVPIYYATNSKIKAFFYTFISAISEPIGAIITYLFLYKYINNFVLGLLFSFIAGMMLQISLCELLPTSREYRLNKITNLFFVIGIIFMVINFIF